MTTKETKKASPPAQARPATGLTPIDEMERLFNEFWSRGWLQPFNLERPRWSEITPPFEGRTPRIDIIERDKDIIVKAELPGVKKEDIDVSVTDTTVSIKGTTRAESRDEKENYYRREISTGSYTRTMNLPCDIDGSKAKSTFSNGLLELTLPKIRKSTRHTIKVQ